MYNFQGNSNLSFVNSNDKPFYFNINNNNNVYSYQKSAYLTGGERANALLQRLVHVYGFHSVKELITAVPEFIPLANFSYQQSFGQQNYTFQTNINAKSITTMNSSSSNDGIESTQMQSISNAKDPLNQTAEGSIASPPSGDEIQSKSSYQTKKVRQDGFKSACDWCTRQRSRCILEEGRSICNRCEKRGTECIFSVAKKRGRPRSRSVFSACKRQRNESCSEGDDLSTHPDTANET